MFEMRFKMFTVGLLGTAFMLPVDLAKADQLGHASWYSLPANITANGEQMNPDELTAAHRSLPLGTRVLVENLSNGRSVIVRINDRGPFIGGRVIDLSKAAAASIDMIGPGTAKVRVVTADDNAVAALGEATAEAKDGASLGAVANVDLAPSETPPKAESVAQSSARSFTAKASSGMEHAASKLHAQAEVTLRNSTDRSKLAKRANSPSRIAVSSEGIRAAAKQASRLTTRRVAVASNEHPYAMLGTTPGFMKPSRSRRRAG